jgi:hypothetical protein
VGWTTPNDLNLPTALSEAPTATEDAANTAPIRPRQNPRF